jgi:hypothetical protein
LQSDQTAIADHMKESNVDVGNKIDELHKKMFIDQEDISEEEDDDDNDDDDDDMNDFK